MESHISVGLGAIRRADGTEQPAAFEAPASQHTLCGAIWKHLSSAALNTAQNQE